MPMPAEGPNRECVIPAPPGGHALHISPQQAQATSRAPATTTGSSTTLPVVEETSAGGIVLRSIDGMPHAALIARRNRAGRLEWCLPKGHLEGAETPPEAAVREIAEETGITGEVLDRLGIIDYWFTGTDRRVHKIVYHYLLDALGGTITVENDPDAEAEAAAWVAVKELPEKLSYPNERRIAVMARSRIFDVHAQPILGNRQ